MKYIAILKDSLREAIDTKVFYVMVILSLIVILFVAGISYTPAPAEEAIPGIVQSQAFRQAYSDRGKSVIPVRNMLKYEVKDLKALTNQENPSARDHVFDLIVGERSPYMLHAVVHGWLNKPDFANLGPPGFQTDAVTVRVTDDQVADYLKNQFGMAGNLEIAEITKTQTIEPDAKSTPITLGSYTFQVKTKGSLGVRGWPHNVSLFFGLVKLPDMFQTSLGRCAFFIENTLIGGFGAWIAILVGVVITSFFIPNMLRKGTVDMLLAKPIHRPTLLITKYIGGLAFVLLSSTIAIGGTWLVLGLRSGIWAPGFLLTIATLTFFFGILYSVSALFAVLTRSPIVAILVTCGAWFALWLVGIGYQSLRSCSQRRSTDQPIQRKWLGLGFRGGRHGSRFVAPHFGHQRVECQTGSSVFNRKRTEGNASGPAA